MTQFPKTIEVIQAAFKAGELTSVDLVNHYFDRIEQVDDTINAFITVAKEQALAQAQAADERGYGENSPALNGVPIGIKDNILTEGIETTAASRMLEGFIPTYDATVVKKLKDAGAVIIGKLNLDEFAMGGSNETSYYGPVHNPWDTKRTPGGSSGGSAAAVAAGMVPASLGTDTGGSIRQPAALNGLVGVKPTYGAVSRYGAIAFGSSFDQVGPLALTVKDAALVTSVISGHDEHDMTSFEQIDTDYSAKIGQSIQGMKIAVPKEFRSDAINEEIRKQVDAAIDFYQSEGAIVEEVSMPSLVHGVNVYYILASAEASSNLQRFDGVRYGYRSPDAHTNEEVYVRSRSEGFGKEVKRRIMIGTYSLGVNNYERFFEKAARIRTLIIEDFKRVFESYDVVIGPVTTNTAYELGSQFEDPIEMYMADLLTVPANLAGLPAMSIPVGLDHLNLPIGMQLIGKPQDEATLFQLAYHFEQAHDFAGQQAPL